jgi:hypothetical protein
MELVRYICVYTVYVYTHIYRPQPTCVDYVGLYLFLSLFKIIITIIIVIIIIINIITGAHTDRGVMAK